MHQSMISDTCLRGCGVWVVVETSCTGPLQAMAMMITINQCRHLSKACYGELAQGYLTREMLSSQLVVPAPSMTRLCHVWGVRRDWL